MDEFQITSLLISILISTILFCLDEASNRCILTSAYVLSIENSIIEYTVVVLDSAGLQIAFQISILLNVSICSSRIPLVTIMSTLRSSLVLNLIRSKQDISSGLG